uniref:Uncharacterized protein n=1 Tax=Picea glauca TaxID=3330 RepID=A0A117NIH5_PICGL|nr:hypothetical protein ABT39_MTgene3215 [Picea glauca]
MVVVMMMYGGDMMHVCCDDGCIVSRYIVYRY